MCEKKLKDNLRFSFNAAFGKAKFRLSENAATTFPYFLYC